MDNPNKDTYTRAEVQELLHELGFDIRVLVTNLGLLDTIVVDELRRQVPSLKPIVHSTPAPTD